MFGKLCIDQDLKVSNLDLGMIVEAAVLFKEVSLVLNHITLGKLLDYFGIDNLVQLIKEGHLKLYYSRDVLGLMQHIENGRKVYSPEVISIIDNPHLEVVQNYATKMAMSLGKARRKSMQLSDRIEEFELPEELEASVIEEVNQPGSTYIAPVLTSILSKGALKSVDEDRLAFRVIAEEPFKYVPQVNAYTASILKTYHIKPEDIISPATGYASIIYRSGALGADINLANKITSRYLEDKFSRLLNHYQREKDETQSIYTYILEETPSIRDLVNSNKIEAHMAVKLILDSRKFKNWLGDLSADSTVVKEYLRKLQEVPLISTLPVRMIRYTIGNGLGVLAPIPAALGFGFLDTFILDNVLAGWKPSVFLNQVSKLQKAATA